MPLDFRRGSIQFDSTTGQTQTELGAVVFPNTVRRADATIAGYDIKFTNGDHEISRQLIDARVERIQDRTVFFRINFLLRDASGNIDDPFSGTVRVLVLADVAPPPGQVSNPVGVATQ